ncbi:unnamed protein product [marine sediment metagenome]|uniref:Uncharacterized protein n=1 Tax=marine sediment metagenome TaxID=412755 RepID=X1A4U1_9ZZZZ
MAKNRGDQILRDRLQFTIDASGDLTTVYGRMDLSAFTGGKKGLAIKEVMFQLRDPAGSNTGVFSLVGDNLNASGSGPSQSSLKLFATTRAYENAADVGIASPDVLCVEEQQWILGSVDAAISPESGYAQWDRHFYGPEDLHPEGFTVVSDLLIGIAFDNWNTQGEQTIELDVLLIADEITLTTERMNALYTQAQDL